jgi:hypothetical protein
MEIAEQEADGIAPDVHIVDDLDIGRDIVSADTADVTDFVDAPCARAITTYVAVGHEGFKAVGPYDV